MARTMPSAAIPCILILVITLILLLTLSPSPADLNLQSVTGPWTHRSQREFWQKDHSEEIWKLEGLLEDLPKHFPADNGSRAPRNITLDSIRSLIHCLEHPYKCPPNKLRVAILGSYHFGFGLTGHHGGEDVWSRSTIEAFDALGFTTLITYDTLEALMIYQAVPDLVEMVVWEVRNIKECTWYGGTTEYAGYRSDTDRKHPDQGGELLRLPGGDYQPVNRQGCLKRDEYPEGIPAWKMFALHWWVYPDHPLGQKWVLAPEEYAAHGEYGPHDDPPNTYLGYSIESDCTRFLPSAERRAHRPKRAYILAKHTSYFDQGRNLFWAPGHQTFKRIKARLGVEFVAGAGNTGDVVPDRGVTNLGRLGYEAFHDELAQSRVLVGLGTPWLSPTPYDALCLGVPFINPIHAWDQEDPDNRDKWNTQHNGVKNLDAPYVYNVKAGDRLGLEQAIKQAVANPIDSYIPERSTARAVRDRLRDILDMPWRTWAQEFNEKAAAEGRPTYAI